MDAFDGHDEEETPGLKHSEDAQRDLRVSYCRKLAQTVLKRAGLKQPPMPVHGLAQAQGFTVLESDLPRGVDALIAPDEARIEVAGGQSPVRHRFSIAHELGHHFLGHAHGDSSVAEQQSNIFAGALLVPGPWLRRDLSIYSGPDALAARYIVSREVIFIALKDARLLHKI